MEMNDKTIANLFAKIEALQHSITAETAPQSTGNWLLKFNEKEISKMPVQFRKTFRAQGCTAHVRKRTDGRYNCSYEIRYAKKPYDKHPISASGTTLEEAKARFIEKIKNYVPTEENNFPAIPKDFDGFAQFWFENFHKPKVAQKTYKDNLSLYNRHIKPKLNSMSLSLITPAVLKELLSSLPGNGKTEDDAHSILNQILELATKNKLIGVNPLGMIFHIPHRRKSGIELTREEEKILMTKIEGTTCEAPIALMLYAGLRPNEVAKCNIQGMFIQAINSKQKGGIIEYKKIPITSFLRNHLQNFTAITETSIHRTRKTFKRIFPTHSLKDLRKTFNTRCVECKVDFIAKECYMGHSLGKLQKAYTGNLDDFLLSEAEKLESWYSLYPKNTP